MLLTKKDKITGHSPAYVMQVAQDHINAYQYDDIDRLMDTVSPRGGIWSGLLPPTGAVIMRTTEEIKAAYSQALQAISIGAGQAFVTVSSDWYVVVSGRTPVTEKVSGQVIESTGLGIYGADELGLAIDTEIGMLTVANRPCPEGVSAAEQSLADCLSHQQRLDAISAGNIEGALIGMADDIDLFMPNFDPKDPVLQVHIGNQSAYREYLNDLFLRYRIEESNVVNRLTTETWIFSEMAWIFVDKESGERLLVRYALVEALTLDGKVRSCVGVAVSD